MTSSRRLVVVYDRGAATVSEIARSLTKVAPLVFVTRENSEHVGPLLPLLRDMGDVVTFRDTPAEVTGPLRATDPGGIVTFSERMLPVTAELAAQLGLSYHSDDTVRFLTDKFCQRQRLRETGTDSVAGQLLTRPEEWPEVLRHVGLPAIVKPVRGEGSRNTYRVDDAEEGRRLVARLLASEPAFVVEEFLQGKPCHSSGESVGDYVSVESIAIRGAVHHIAVTGKFPLVPPFRETGQFWPAALPEKEQQLVRDLAEKAIRALGVTTGITHTEIKLTDTGPRVIEVNGRLGGNINALSLRAAGPDLVELAGRLALGEAVDAPLVAHDRVVFQYSNLAPSFPCRLDSVAGQRQLRSTVGITGYRAWIRPGTQLDGGVSTSELDLIHGEADDHSVMIQLLREVLPHLTFTFTSPVGQVEISAPDLLAKGGARPG
ncbi:ATP-grasp domain-containing protein [Streptomyces prunicolor]|uniref:ATP-grasp domain-containing protein n=1 Tax=Streptomyces prunicolor TaxID=67348 RepID=UPI00341B53ED